MSSYLPSERETVLQTDDESGRWSVHTYQGKIQTKLKRAGIEPTETYPDGGARYDLDFAQVSFRAKSKGGRTMTQEQKDAARDRLAEARKNKLNK